MGWLLGIARAGVNRAPLVEISEAGIDVTNGIEGDARGAKPGRQVTVLFREGWEAACRELRVSLPWVTRRANLYVEGLEIPHQGSRLVIGQLTLEVTQETQPCSLMEAAHRGLRAALKPEWRGGVCCNVITGGRIHVGDEVRLG
jgi:MOSC domain-containing protein YiiM